MKITITRSAGYLKIEPPMEELITELTFNFKTKDKIAKTFFDPKIGKKRQILVDGPLKVIKKNLFKFTKDEKAIITYDGLLPRIEKFLTSGKHEFDVIEPDEEIYATPIFNDRVLEGLYPDQIEAVEKIINHDGGCLVDAATNTGKTRIIASLCRAFSQHMGLVVTNRQSVALKLYGDLQKLAPECDPGCHLSDKKAKGRTIVITSASLKNYNPLDISFIIYDETHSAASPARSADLLRFNLSKKIGLSGTLSGGFKGVLKYLEAIFGPVVFKLTDQELESMGRATPLHVYVMDVKDGPTFTPKTQNFTMQKNGIWLNRYRNRLIKECVDVVPPDQQMVIYVGTVTHINELMEQFLGDYEFEIYHGSLKTKEKARIMEGFNSGSMKRIISTDCLAEGVDPQNLFVTLNANWAQSDTSALQKAGRNRRLSDGKTYGVVIEFNDCWDERMERKSKNRIKHYRDRGYTVIEGKSPSQIQFLTINE